MTEPEAEGPLVAIVDDERDVRTTIGLGLKKHGYRCHPFSSGQDLIDALGYVRPDCILLDLRMPGMDGIETLKAIGDAYRHVPVILFTSHGDIPKAIEAMKAGAEDLIEKPASLKFISETIDRALAERQPLREQTHSVLMARELIAQLTPRERQVIELACDGLTSSAIAEQLDLSVRTVESHRHNAIKKLQEDKIVNILRLFQEAKAQ
jgi:RNA polymerase sigma factor (sigma-70 family)